MAVQLKGWRNLAVAVLLRAAPDAGTANGGDVMEWSLSPICEAWCELVDVRPATFIRAVVVKASAGGGRVMRKGGWFFVGPRSPEEHPKEGTPGAESLPAGPAAAPAEGPKQGRPRNKTRVRQHKRYSR